MEIELFYNKHLFLCVNQRDKGSSRGCCADKGAIELRDYLKDKCKELGLSKGAGSTRINTSLCLDRCELGPVLVIYPEGVWYHYASKQDIDEIIDTHLIKNQIVDRLRLYNHQKKL